jgi:hypothetical protein
MLFNSNYNRTREIEQATSRSVDAFVSGRKSAVLLRQILLLSIIWLPSEGRTQEHLPVELISSVGKSLNGHLVVRPNGSLEVIAEAKTIPLAELPLLRNPNRDRPPLKGRLIHRLTLRNGDTIFVRLLNLQGDHLEVETRWQSSLKIPQTVLSEIGPSSEGQPLSLEGFERDLSSQWKIDPAPVFDATFAHSETRGLSLDLPKDASRFSFPQPQASGSLRFWFRLPEGKSSGGFSLLSKSNDQEAKIRLFWDAKQPHFQCEIPGEANARGEIPVTPGWHLFQAEWDEYHFQFIIDDLVAISQRGTRQLRTIHGIEFTSGKFGIDDLVLFEPAETNPPKRLDPKRAELWRRNLDQLLVEPQTLDEEGVGYTIQKKNRTEPWSGIRTLSFPRLPEPKGVEAVGQVRLQLLGFDSTRDRIEGVLKKGTAKQIEIDHPLLGKLQIPAGAWREIKAK